MTRAALLAALVALTACDAGPGQPQLGLGLGFGPRGVRVVPRVTTNVGGVGVGLGPGGTSIGTSVGGVGVGASI
jgi:hypothetical protein